MFISNWDVVYFPPLAPPNKKNKKNGIFFDNQKLGRNRKDQFPPISAVPFMVASMEAESFEASRVKRVVR